MTIKQFINENKTQIFILAVLFLIIFFYLYDKKENMGTGMKVGGSIIFAISAAILSCICWCLIMYFIIKKGASAAIRESSSNRNINPNPNQYKIPYQQQ
jgi:hypothetical protein